MTLQLHVSLDQPLPPEIAIGRGTALFIAGTCFCPAAPLRSLAFVVDGRLQPVMAHGMPRLDFFRAMHPGLDPYATAALDSDPESDEDPLLLAYRSGFWGIARVGPSAAGGDCELGLRAILDDDRELELDLGRIPRVGGPARLPAHWPAGADGPRVAICMATYNPPAGLLERQLDSIRAQTHRNWVCVISDDCSAPEPFERLRAAVGSDSRFILTRAPRRGGFYRNFERALALAPDRAELVAMADQDDYWYPDKLASLVAGLGDANLIYSDARIVDPSGSVLAESYWGRRRNNHSDLLSLLVANAVTGAASMFRADLLEYALPFPPAQFAHFHDHWIGLVALALGEVAFLDRPLYDYVQHGAASLGHHRATTMMPLSERLVHQRSIQERVRWWRLHYFVDVCRLYQFATILSLRCDARMSARKRRILRRFLAGERSPVAGTALALRGLRELLGRRPETLGAEWMLAHALAWRALLAASVRPRPQRRLRLDAVPPPALNVPPGAGATLSEAAAVAPARAVADKIAPLELGIADDAPQRVNVLIPTIELEHFFGGYIAKLNLARRLAEKGIRVRLVTVDPVGPLPPEWKRTIESYGGLAGLFDRVEVAYGRGPAPLEVSRSDGFIATTWWTAHIAAAAVRALRAERFVYLIQEFEPFTFPMGSYAALADQSYRFEHFALFSTELLREYFRRHAVGVFASGETAGEAASASFENAITAVSPPRIEDLTNRGSRRLLFYARPEPHAARNMFELGVLALASAVRDGAFQGGWELHGTGTTAAGQRIPLGAGAAIELIPRSGQAAYGELLRRHDLGLALMYTPHPSLVPIEMASAGMLTVTNSFENKTAEAMNAISTNMITVEPTVDAVAEGLLRAAAAVEGYDRRVRGSAVNWSNDWDRSFDDGLLSRVAAALGAPIRERISS